MIVEGVELTDRVGNYLNPGDIIAYSLGSKSALKIGVFSHVKVIERKNYYNDGIRIGVTPIIKMIRKNGQVRTQALKRSYHDKERFDGKIENMVVVQLPEFKLDIPEICQCLEIIDDMKDEGVIKE